MRRYLRMLEWLVISVLLLAILHAFDTQLAVRTAQKLANVTLFGWTGWMFSVGVYKMLAPKLEQIDPDVRDAVVQGRAIIIAGAMIAGALGL